MARKQNTMTPATITVEDHSVVVLQVACAKSGWQQQAAMYAMASKICGLLESAAFTAAIDPVLGHQHFYIRLELADDSRFKGPKRKLAADYIPAAKQLLAQFA